MVGASWGFLGYIRAAEKRWREIERGRRGHGDAVPLREFFAGAEGLVIVRIGQ